MYALPGKWKGSSGKGSHGSGKSRAQKQAEEEEKRAKKEARERKKLEDEIEAAREAAEEEQRKAAQAAEKEAQDAIEQAEKEGEAAIKKSQREADAASKAADDAGAQAQKQQEEKRAAAAADSEAAVDAETDRKQEAEKETEKDWEATETSEASATAKAAAIAEEEAANAEAASNTAAAGIAINSNCISIDPTSGSDYWCMTTCAQVNGYCPPTICTCDPDEKEAIAAEKRLADDATVAAEQAASAAAAGAADAAVAAGASPSPQPAVEMALHSNAPVFLKAWRTLFAQERLFKHEWIVKVDADAVFLPFRLKAWLPPPVYTPLVVANCAMSPAANVDPILMALGSVETINVAAARSFNQSINRCHQDVEADGGEDRFLNDCALKLGWEFAFQVGVTADLRCPQSYDEGCGTGCGGSCESAAFHPFRSLDEFEACHVEARDAASGTQAAVPA